jgi:ATP-dependent Clp protease ATP-binding subunit ClpX
MENVQLRFTDGVLEAIANDAIKRKSGARGLRAILESVMLDIMYDIPSTPGITECIINEDVVTKREPPLLIYEKQAKFG